MPCWRDWSGVFGFVPTAAGFGRPPDRREFAGDPGGEVPEELWQRKEGATDDAGRKFGGAAGEGGELKWKSCPQEEFAYVHSARGNTR